MKIELQEGNHMLTVRLYGELDYHTVGKVREVIDKAIAQAVGKTLLLNLAGVPFMDSSGLGLILGRYRRFCEQPGQLILTAPASQVRRLLELSGVDRIIPIYNTEEEAYQLREEVE